MGMLTLAEGVSSYLESRWLPALESCDRAEGILRDRCTGVAWELDTAHAYALWALSHLGRWSELSRRVPMLLNEARERGDLYASMNLSTYVRSIMGIASDEAEAARQESLRVMSQWSKHGYHVQHNDQVWALVQIDLYLGNGQAAWERITHHWPTLTRSLLMRVQFIRVAMIGLRARCALSAVNAKNGLYDLAQKDASRLDREKLPWASAQAMMIRAGVAKLQGHAEEIPLHLSQASAAFAACDMALCAAVAEMRLGQVIGGAEGTAKLEQSRDFMKAQSIVNPDRVADLFAPGFK